MCRSGHIPYKKHNLIGNEQVDGKKDMQFYLALTSAGDRRWRIRVLARNMF